MKKIIKHIYKKEEIYKGKYLSEAPDLILDQEKGAQIIGGIGKRGVFDFTEKWVAENKKHGLFALYGNGIKEGVNIKNFRILDLAPTILHMFGLPVPRDMDGKVLKEIFKEYFPPVKREVVYHKRQDKKAEERKRIKEAVKRLKI
jgi:predicted AlkP superfamily phosphohydrolase/phosphomutase